MHQSAMGIHGQRSDGDDRAMNVFFLGGAFPFRPLKKYTYSYIHVLAAVLQARARQFLMPFCLDLRGIFQSH